MDYIRQIEDANNRRMNALRPPHRKEVLKAREDDIKEKVQNWMSKENEPRLQRISSELLEEYNDVELVASLLQELVGNDEVEVQLTFENHYHVKDVTLKEIIILEEAIINVVAVNSIIKIDVHQKVSLQRRIIIKSLIVKINHLKTQTKQ